MFLTVVCLKCTGIWKLCIYRFILSCMKYIKFLLIKIIIYLICVVFLSIYRKLLETEDLTTNYIQSCVNDPPK